MSLVELVMRALTTTWLSECRQIWQSLQRGPQTATAMAMGKNCLAAMFMELQSSGHWTWNQKRGPSRNAPQPHEPEASAVMDGPKVLEGNKPVPFQPCMKADHQNMSALHPGLSLVKWDAFFSSDFASINCGLPAGTTCAASKRSPTRTSS